MAVTDLAIKAVIPLLAIISAGLGIYTLTKKSPEDMPSYISLKVSNKVSEYTEDTHIGKKYSPYLITPFRLDNEKQIDVFEWWRWSYERWLIDNQAGKVMHLSFKGKEKVTTNYAEESNSSVTNSLNKVCKNAYLKKSTDFATEPHLELSIWKYCSFVLHIPYTIFTKNEHESKYKSLKRSIALSDSKSTLLSVSSDPGNDKIWELKNEEFKALSSVTEKYFKSAKEANVNLKKACSDAYKLASDETNAATDPKKTKSADVDKFCSINLLS